MPLGLFRHLHFWFLLFIPRIAGSLRTIRSLASDLQLEPPGTRRSNPGVLSTSSPGFFLGLEIPRNTSLIKVYGRKGAGPSLYGICLECNGTFEIVNATSSPTSEQEPSCLFSLALGGHNTGRRLELRNLYDPDFGTYGEISFSLVEYIFDDNGNSPTPAASMQLCEHHLHWSPRSNVLLRRDSAPTQTTRGGMLRGQMNTLIILIAALITIVVLMFIVVALYILYRHRLFQLKEDPEGRGREAYPRSPLRDKSTTLVAIADTIDPEAPSKDMAESLPKDGYIIGQQETFLSDPTSSFSTHVDLARTDNRSPVPTAQANTKTPTIRRAPSRPKANPPPSDPPKVPVPAVPKALEPLLIRPMRRKDSMMRLPDGSASPSIPPQSRVKPQRSPYQTDGVSVHTLERLVSDIPKSPRQAHVRNESSSDTSPTSSNGRFKSRPPSKVLPPVPLQSFHSHSPSGSLPKSTPAQIHRPLTQNNLEGVEASQHVDGDRQPGGKLIEDQTRMQTIPESARSTRDENTSPSPAVPTAAAPKFTRFPADVPEDVQAQARTPQEFRSSLRPGRSELVHDNAHWGALAQPPSGGDRGELKHVRPVEASQGETRQSSMARPSPRTRLSVKIPADPDDWFTPSSVAISLPSSNEGKPPFEMRKPLISNHNTSLRHIKQSSDGKGVLPQYTTSTRRGNSRPTGVQYPTNQLVTRVQEQSLPMGLPAIAPLSPHRRTLPKIPT